MYTIFYSWQSTLPNADNRGLIEKAILKATTQIDKFKFKLDKDTRGETGSPNITNKIFEKIEKAILFVCDITIVTENARTFFSNSNVMIELGYAIKILGWDRIICVNNTKYSRSEDLPFNIRQNRLLNYNSENRGNALDTITKVINENIQKVIEKQLIYDEVFDYTKKKIDYVVLQITGIFVNLFKGPHGMKETLVYFDEILKMSCEDIENNLVSGEFLGFFLMSNFLEEKKTLDNLIKDLQSSKYIAKEWLAMCIKLEKWIVGYNDTTSYKFSPELFIKTGNMAVKFKVIDARSLNPKNKGHILLDKDNRVLNSATLSVETKLEPLQLIKINKNEAKVFTILIMNFFDLVREWLDMNDGDIILDERFYKFRKPDN